MRKQQRRLERRKASREGLPALLIVCEGRETDLRINAAAVHVVRGESVTDSAGLVRKAQRMFKSDDNYDLV